MGNKSKSNNQEKHQYDNFTMSAILAIWYWDQNRSVSSSEPEQIGELKKNVRVECPFNTSYVNNTNAIKSTMINTIN